jgi:HD superfamily phosphodiesterase
MTLNLASRSPDPAWFVRSHGEDGSSLIHGVGHARRVTAHAFELAMALRLPAWQVEAARLAGLWHDIGREHDGGDYFHGARSAGKVIGLGLHRGVAPATLEVALLAVTFHNVPDSWGERAAGEASDRTSALAVFRVLKDADALDRVRFGPRGLDPTLLRFKESHARIERAVELVRSAA